MNKRIAVIPARVGSKRIHKKNIRNFCGLPMISYIIKAASASGVFDAIHVSTDSVEVADLVAEFGVKVDFLRPKHLADDHTPIMPVLKFVLEEYRERGVMFDSVALLMACAPMVTAENLCEAAELFDSHNGKKSVLSITQYPCPIEWAFRRLPSGMLLPVQPGMFSVRSQDLESAYCDAGQFCFMPSERVLTSIGAGSDEGFLGYEIKRHQAIDIDTMEDWQFAEIIFNCVFQYGESLKK